MATKHIAGEEGIKRRVGLGLHISSLPMGYKTIYKDEVKMVIIHPTEEIIVKTIYALFIEDKISMSAIAKLLQKKYRRVFHSSNIHRILTNPFYRGLVRYKGGDFEHNYPRIIDDETWQKAQDRREAIGNKRHSRHDTSNFLFRKLLRCEECSSLLSGEMQKGHIYYSCKSRTIYHEKKYLRQDRILEQINPVCQMLGISPELIQTAEAMSIFFSIVFKMIGVRKNLLVYEIHETVPRLMLKKYLEDAAKKEAVKLNPENPQSSLIEFCRTEKTLDEIAVFINKSIDQVQLMIMDEVLNGNIEETLEGKYVTI